MAKILIGNEKIGKYFIVNTSNRHLHLQIDSKVLSQMRNLEFALTDALKKVSTFGRI